MRSPRSSSPDTSAWYRDRWPWMLIAGPAIVVIACMATTVIAVRSDDGVVAGDYYKRGLLVNQRLPKDGAVTPHYAATLALDADGAIRVRPEAGDAHGDFLRVTLYHPASGARETLTLRRSDDGAFRGKLAESREGRWIVTVESADWPLPTTLVDRGATTRTATSAAIR